MNTAASQTTKELDAFERGAWFAFDEVLGWVNTQPEQNINKKTLYKWIMNLRPACLVRNRNWLAERESGGNDEQD